MSSIEKEHDHSRRVVLATDLPRCRPVTNRVVRSWTAPAWNDTFLRWFPNGWEARKDLKLQSSLSSGVYLQGFAPKVCHRRRAARKFLTSHVAIVWRNDLRYNRACHCE